MINDVYILAIETSCDDTSVAILKNQKVLSNIVSSQKIHEIYGGVVPELASREHDRLIIPVLKKAINDAGVNLVDIHAIAYTRGPGLLGSLLVGTSFAKSLSLSLDIPLIEINHMQAHILSIFIDDNPEKPEFPFIALTVSGGHTQLVLVKDYDNFVELGTTLDDAAGEAFDKALSITDNPTVTNNVAAVKHRKAGKGNDDIISYLESSNTSESKYNLGLIRIEEGKYEEAITLMDKSKTYNLALANLLAEHYDVAGDIIEDANSGEANAHYLKAIMGARTNNSEMLFENLKSCFDKDASYKNKAKKDREFVAYFDNADFLALF